MTMHDLDASLERQLSEWIVGRATQWTAPAGLRERVAAIPALPDADVRRGGRRLSAFTLPIPAMVVVGLALVAVAAGVLVARPLPAATDVDRLFESTSTCDVVIVGHTVHVTYPASWSASECTSFGPGPLQPNPQGRPHGTMIVIGGVPSPPLHGNRDPIRGEVAGLPWIRATETTNADDGQSYRHVVYYITLDPAAGGPAISVGTLDAAEAELDEYAEVLDEVVERLTFDGRTEIPVGGERAPVLPGELAAARRGMAGGLAEPGWLPDRFALVFVFWAGGLEQASDLRYEDGQSYVQIWQAHRGPGDLGPKEPFDYGDRSAIGDTVDWSSVPVGALDPGGTTYSAKLPDGRSISVTSNLDSDVMERVLQSIYVHDPDA